MEINKEWRNMPDSEKWEISLNLTVPIEIESEECYRKIDSMADLDYEDLVWIGQAYMKHFFDSRVIQYSFNLKTVEIEEADEGYIELEAESMTCKAVISPDPILERYTDPEDVQRLLIQDVIKNFDMTGKDEVTVPAEYDLDSFQFRYDLGLDKFLRDIRPNTEMWIRLPKMTLTAKKIKE